MSQMVSSVRKAIFPVAGLGTRFLPATKAMPKELLPVINKPLIQYAVEEAIDAGCDELIFITGKNKRAIEEHFCKNFDLESALEKAGNYAQLENVRNILPENIECTFVCQSEQLGLGHAVLCAENLIGNDPFLVLLADDFLSSDGDRTSKTLVDAYKKTKNPQISVMEVNGPSISNYGVVELKRGTTSVLGISEKPNYEDAKSNLASIGRYLLTPEIFDILKVQKEGYGGEIQLADALNEMANSTCLGSVLLRERRFDCGSARGYLEASIYLSLIHI